MDLQLPMQSVPITTEVVSSIPAHDEVYSIHYVIKIVGGFLRVLLFPPPVKLAPQYRRDIVESGVKHHNLNPCILSSRESCWPIHIFFYGCVHMPPQKVPCLDFNSKSNA